MPELNPHFPKPKHVIVREKTIPPNFTASFIDKRIHECQSSGRFRELLTEMLSTEAQIFRYFVGGRQCLFLPTTLQKNGAGNQKFIIPENLWLST